MLYTIASHFALEGQVAHIAPLGHGLINDSYRVVTKGENSPDYVLQRINHSIFKDVDMLQHNMQLVTTHIRAKLVASGEQDVDRKVLRFLSTKQGKAYYYDGSNYWRAMVFIPRAVTHDTVSPKYAYYAGVAFGEFQGMLADMPEELGETIPSFHNMEFRLQQFRKAIAQDAAGRLAQVKDLVDELELRADYMCRAEQLYREGKLPKRICHCDTKVNNILFDEDGTILCVIDLDTVMPSYIFSDFGDFMRSAGNTGDEDDTDLDRVSLNMEIFRAFAKGYLQSAQSFLTQVEIDHLPYAVSLFPYMQCVRFLTDYINGDTYYKTSYAAHNLARSKAQFKLLQSAERHREEMESFVASQLQK